MQSQLGVAIARLSSGMRINSASDDAAGLAIANRMTSRIKGSSQALRNVQDADSLIQTTLGSLDQINANLQRIRELGVQRLSGTYSQADKSAMALEINDLKAEITRVAQSTSFNGVQSLKGQGQVNFQIGAGSDDVLTLDLQGMTSDALQVGNPPFVGEAFTEYTKDGVTLPVKLGNYGYGYTPQVNTPTFTPEVFAAYYGTTVDQVTFHHYLKPDGTVDPNLYVIKLGDYYHYDTIGDLRERQPGYLIPGLANAALGVGNWQFVYTDVENGIMQSTPVDAPVTSKLYGWTKDNKMVLYIEYKGEAYKQIIDVNGDIVFNMSGPDQSKYDIWRPEQILIQSVDSAINKLDAYRSYLGAMANRLDSVASNLNADLTATQAARSRIEDTDYALEVSSMTRAQILSQAAQSALSQANQMPSGILALLNG